jgi:hypothetical protein
LLFELKRSFDIFFSVLGVVGQLGIPWRAISIMSVQVLFGYLLKFGIVDCFPVTLEFLRIDFESINS